MIGFKALAALLDYPTAEMKSAAEEIRIALASENLLDSEIGGFIDEIAATDLLDLQERWVGLFDRSKRLALHLHEHSYGESRDRGQAMVNLATAYRMHGFEMASSEMPDYLPLFLEFLSQIPEEVARRYLADAIDIVEALRIRLEERESTYAVLLKPLLRLSATKADEGEVKAILAGEPEDPENLDELDAQWAEEPVDFAAGSALKDCPFAGGIGRERAAAFANAGA